jgi:hypothetical protein
MRYLNHMNVTLCCSSDHEGQGGTANSVLEGRVLPGAQAVVGWTHASSW